jgi:hypothetical protein
MRQELDEALRTPVYAPPSSLAQCEVALSAQSPLPATTDSIDATLSPDKDHARIDDIWTLVCGRWNLRQGRTLLDVENTAAEVDGDRLPWYTSVDLCDDVVFCVGELIRLL